LNFSHFLAQTLTTLSALLFTFHRLVKIQLVNEIKGITPICAEAPVEASTKIANILRFFGFLGIADFANRRFHAFLGIELDRHSLPPSGFEFTKTITTCWFGIQKKPNQKAIIGTISPYFLNEPRLGRSNFES
jgi:hypothetical protein